MPGPDWGRSPDVPGHLLSNFIARQYLLMRGRDPLKEGGSGKNSGGEPREFVGTAWWRVGDRLAGPGDSCYRGDIRIPAQISAYVLLINQTESSTEHES